MPSANRIIIASAGSGKTTTIVSEAAESPTLQCALITYTNNNSAELRTKAHELYGLVPVNMTTSTWYTFLLRHLVRPYQTALYGQRVSDVAMTNGRSAKFAAETDIGRHYFAGEGRIYLDKVTKFACKIIEKTKGAPLRRLEQIFDRIYVDEVQDIAAWDLELIAFLLDSDIEITMVGDVRQATYRTNNQAKNSTYSGPKILSKFVEWCDKPNTSIEYQAKSHRCVQAICDYSDSFYPELPKSQSHNKKITGHDGVFLVRETSIADYVKKFNPQSLRLRKTNAVIPGRPINYGAAKGMSFDRVLIFPHKKLLDVIKTGDISKLGSSTQTKAKVYVGITRARQSVGIVVPKSFKTGTLPFYDR